MLFACNKAVLSNAYIFVSLHLHIPHTCCKSIYIVSIVVHDVDLSKTTARFLTTHRGSHVYGAAAINTTYWTWKVIWAAKGFGELKGYLYERKTREYKCASAPLQAVALLLLTEEGGGDDVDVVLLRCVHLLPSHFAKDHSINKRICWKF